MYYNSLCGALLKLSKTITSTYEKFGPNERAIVDKVRINPLKNFIILIIGVKLRLQFTGWLQYLVPLPFALLSFLIALIFLLFGATSVSAYFAFTGSFLLAIVTFDILTARFGLQPRQGRPTNYENLSRLELLLKRKSCRSYQRRKVTNSDLQEVLSSAKKHTTSAKFSRHPIRLEYISAPLTVWPTVNASQFLVALAPAEYDRMTVIEVGYKLQQVVIDATRLGLGTCWIGPGADHKSVIRHLGEKYDPKRDSIICVCAFGYPSWFMPLFIRIFSKVMRRRLPLSDLFYADESMKKSLEIDKPPFSKFKPVFEASRWAPSSYNGQTTRCVGLKGDGGDLRFDFYAITSSRYYAPVAVGIWCANWSIGCKSLGIDGDFALLSSARREIANSEGPSTPPRYDLSWVQK